MNETIFKALEQADDPDFEDTITVDDTSPIELAAWKSGLVILTFGGTDIEGELTMTADEAASLAKSLLDATQVAGCKHFKG